MNSKTDQAFTLPSSELADHVHETRKRTLELVSDLTDEHLVVPKIDILNPVIWELGHIAFFYDVFLLRNLETDEFLMSGAEKIYDSFRVDHSDRWDLPLPSRKETLDYMQRVMQRTVDRLGSRKPTPQETYLYLLTVLHEDMHGEAITYSRQTLKYPKPELSTFGNGPDTSNLNKGPLPGDVEIAGGKFQLGAPPDTPFLFDNEKWSHPVDLAPYKIARTPVTNAEFAAFVDDQGYLRSELWSHQGWVWRTKQVATQPNHWKREGNQWYRWRFNELVPLENDHPIVHVTWYEAEAYCRWAKRRLPTEAEWDLAASGEPTANGKGIKQRKRRYPWGDDPPTRERANLDSRLLGTVDVAAFPAGDSAFGCRQMLGNVWEWTESAFYPFPGYIVDWPYKEYSAPWFGFRKVLKGGAWATRSRLANNSYRNFFEPHRRDVLAGFRTCALE
ncbi:MAG: ergothioneine biosynthesis protein EgtB [Deltaproteobacteria bacterium]|nr:ergothioneine biosynthesis protein EgtB [Deltaproteobacteria bacterium]